MNCLKQLQRRLRYLFKRDTMDADLAEEMKLHLDLRAADQIASGVKPEDADAAARRQFGNVTRLKEKGREAWGWNWLDSLAQDVRYGWRNLMTARGFTITAVLSLALGIGANTAIFSIINAAILRSLPVPDPHRIAKVSLDGNEHLTNPLWEAIRDQQNTFDGTFAFSSERFDLAQEGEKRMIDGLFVSGDFFKTLGVAPQRGRLFNREDDLAGGGRNGPVAVISHTFWKNHFGSDPNIVGKTIQLDANKFAIIGVTAPNFSGVEAERPFNVAVPIGCHPLLHTDGDALKNRSMWWLRVGGRLQTGVDFDQASERLKVVAPGIMRDTLPDWDDKGKANYAKQMLQAKPGATGFSGLPAEGRQALYLMMGVVAIVLLIACANIANLLLARASARQQEICVRLAIGAGRARLIRQLLTESLLLAALGIPGGLLLGKWASLFITRKIAPGGRPLELDVSMDTNVLLFTIAISLATGIIFGFAPALRATRVSTNDVLKRTSRGSGSGGSRFRLGRALVAGQVALSLALLVGAGLFVNTLRNLLNVSLGFNQNNVLIVKYDSRSKIPKEQRVLHYESIRERLKKIPGIGAASSSMVTPISGMAWNGFLTLDGAPTPDESTEKGRRNITWFNRVSAGFFDSLRAPILMGRDFNEADIANAPRVVIVGEKTARDLFGTKNPVGKHLRMDAGPGPKELFEIIGVVADTKYASLTEKARRTAFVPLTQDTSPWPEISYLLRTESPHFDGVTPAVRAAIAEVAPGSSIEFKSLAGQVASSLSQQRLIAILVAFFGALALLLAAVGLYGVTSYAAAQRQGEIGIRMALGAQRSSVIWLVLRDVAIVMVIGSILGAALALGAGRAIGALMFGIEAHDPGTFFVATAILLVAGLAAGLLPALRASRLDPAVALRCE